MHKVYESMTYAVIYSVYMFNLKMNLFFHFIVTEYIVYIFWTGCMHDAHSASPCSRTVSFITMKRFTKL